MKTYNFTYIRSVDATSVKEARELFKDMLEDVSGMEVFESGEIEEDGLPE